MRYAFVGTRRDTGQRGQWTVEAGSLKEALAASQRLGFVVEGELRGVTAPDGRLRHAAENDTRLSTRPPAARPQGNHPGPPALRTSGGSRLLVGLFVIGFGFVAAAGVAAVAGAAWLLTGEKRLASADPWDDAGSSGLSGTETVPAPDPEVMRRARVEAATRSAWAEIERIETEFLSLYTRYDEACAREIVRRYRAVPTEDVDGDLRVWISDMIAAAEALTQGETERRVALEKIELNRGANARAVGGAVGELAAENGETAGEQVANGVAGIIGGAILSNVATEMEKGEVNRLYDQRLQATSSALKQKHEQGRAEVRQALSARYSWPSKGAAE